jgi:hypothetical protein
VRAWVVRVVFLRLDIGMFVGVYIIACVCRCCGGVRSFFLFDHSSRLDGSVVQSSMVNLFFVVVIFSRVVILIVYLFVLKLSIIYIFYFFHLLVCLFICLYLVFLFIYIFIYL